MEAVKALVPVDMSLLGTDGVAAQADSISKAIGKFLLRQDFLLTAFFCDIVN